MMIKITVYIATNVYESVSGSHRQELQTHQTPPLLNLFTRAHPRFNINDIDQRLIRLSSHKVIRESNPRARRVTPPLFITSIS